MVKVNMAVFGLPWWVWAYVLLIGVIGLRGIWSDLKEGHSPLYALISFLPTVFLLSFVLAFWVQNVQAWLGMWVWLFFGISLLWEGSSVTSDFRQHKLGSNGSSERQFPAHLAALGLYFVTVLPAFAWGGIVCVRMFP